MTIPEFKAYLIEMAAKATEVEKRFPTSGADNLAAQMWKQFTPAALYLWTTLGVLEHVAACLTPVEEEDDEDKEEE